MEFIRNMFKSAWLSRAHSSLCVLRLGIGILTIIHGIPKIMAGTEGWHMLGQTFMSPLGIHFAPIAWGFLGAAAEFFGGIALVLGVGTRLATLALIIMMSIATAWHVLRGDPFMIYSFPLSMIIVYLSLFIAGDDSCLTHWKHKK